MAGYKVEICGVNTAKLPLLKEDEKEMLMKRIKSHDLRAREHLSMVISGWFSVLYSVSRVPMKMSMIFFRWAVSAL